MKYRVKRKSKEIANATVSSTEVKVVNKATKEASRIPNPARLIGMNEKILTIAIINKTLGKATAYPAEENKKYTKRECSNNFKKVINILRFITIGL